MEHLTTKEKLKNLIFEFDEEFDEEDELLLLEELQEPFSTNDFFITILILLIPVINILALLIWSTDEYENVNRKNFAKACLLIIFGAFTLSILFIFQVVMFSISSSKMEEYYNFYEEFYEEQYYKDYYDEYYDNYYNNYFNEEQFKYDFPEAFFYNGSNNPDMEEENNYEVPDENNEIIPDENNPIEEYNKNDRPKRSKDDLEIEE